jgi:hypothetical protein
MQSRQGLSSRPFGPQNLVKDRIGDKQAPSDQITHPLNDLPFVLQLPEPVEDFLVILVVGEFVPEFVEHREISTF